MLFRLPIVKFFNRILNRITVTVVLVALQLAWLAWVFFALTTGTARVWVTGVLNGLSLLIILYLVRKDENSAYKVGWIALIGLLPLLGGALYLAFGNKRPSRRLRSKMQAVEQAHRTDRAQQPGQTAGLCDENRGVSRYLTQYGCYPAWQNTTARYFSCGEAMYPALLADLEKAEKSIFLEFFIVSQGKMWQGVEDILRRKAAQGVDVRLIYDDFGSLLGLPKDFVVRMERAHIRCIPFNPVVPLLSLVMNHRDHRKIVVIDGRIAYTGGVNIADESANLIERFGYWKDSGVCLEGEGAWGLTASFIRMCVNLGGVMHNEHDYYRPHTPVKSEGFCQPFTDGPQNNPDNPAEDVFLQMISGARRFLYITTPYFIPDESLMRALCIAGDGGVDVRLMLPGKPDHWYADCVAESYFGELIKHGVKVYRYTPGFLHGKSIMVDREAAFVGSANMDYRSFELDYECGVMVYSVPMIESLLEDMDMIVDHSRLVTKEEWAKRSVLRRVFEPLLRLFAIWM